MGKEISKTKTAVQPVFRGQAFLMFFSFRCVCARTHNLQCRWRNTSLFRSMCAWCLCTYKLNLHSPWAYFRVFNDSQLAEQQRSWLVSISNFTRGSRCSESSSDFLSSLQNKNNKTQSSCDFPECEKHFFLSSRKVFLIRLWARHGSQMSMNSIFKPFWGHHTARSDVLFALGKDTGGRYRLSVVARFHSSGNYEKSIFDVPLIACKKFAFDGFLSVYFHNLRSNNFLFHRHRFV